jgi:hypothetical protein
MHWYFFTFVPVPEWLTFERAKQGTDELDQLNLPPCIADNDQYEAAGDSEYSPGHVITANYWRNDVFGAEFGNRWNLFSHVVAEVGRVVWHEGARMAADDADWFCRVYIVTSDFGVSEVIQVTVGYIEYHFERSVKIAFIFADKSTVDD